MQIITDPYRYNRCIELAAKLDQITHLIEDMEEIEEELLDEDDYNKCIVHTAGVIGELADIMRHMSNWYTKSGDCASFNPTIWGEAIPIPNDKELYVRVNVKTE